MRKRISLSLTSFISNLFIPSRKRHRLKREKTNLLWVIKSELDDPADTVEDEDEDADEDDAHEDDEDESDADADEAPEDDAAEDPVEEPDEIPGGEPEEDPGEGAAGEPMPAPTPPPPPPPAVPLPPVAEAVVDERTPCEIAADELPQVGESPPSEPGGG